MHATQSFGTHFAEVEAFLVSASTFAACVGAGCVAVLGIRYASGPLRAQLRHIRNWLWLLAVPCSLLAWLHEVPMLPEGIHQNGFTVLFPGYRRLAVHRINQPKEGRRRLVILGASNMAGWAGDYRGSLFDYRHKHDIWGRASLAACMEKELGRQGIPSRVENLGVNAGNVFTELSLFLYTMERQPDLVIHGLVAPSFAPNADKLMPEVRNELRARLATHAYADKEQLEKTLLVMLASGDPRASGTPTMKPSRWDGIIGRAGGVLVGAYRSLGLPPLVTKFPNSTPSAAELKELLGQPLPPYYLEWTRRALTTYADVPLIMHRIARSRGVPYVAVLPPDLESATRPFYQEYGAMLRARGLTVLDLSQLGLQYGTETYDGCHSTVKGNAITAKRILDELSGMKVFP